MIAGAVGGIVLWTVIFPTDVIKSRVQISNKSQKFLTVGYDIVRQEGLLRNIILYNLIIDETKYNNFHATLMLPITGSLLQLVINYLKPFHEHITYK